jgi:hypothetical protein
MGKLEDKQNTGKISSACHIWIAGRMKIILARKKMSYASKTT